MNSKEIAMHLAIEHYKIRKDNLIDTYFEYLDKISAHKTNTLEGKLKEMINDYDNKIGHSSFDNYEFIDSIRKLLKEE